MPLEHVAVIGAGAWGTALAQAAAIAGRAGDAGRARSGGDRRDQRPAHATAHIWAISSCRPGIRALADAARRRSRHPRRAGAGEPRGVCSMLRGLRGKPVVLTAKGLEARQPEAAERNPRRDRARRDPLRPVRPELCRRCGGGPADGGDARRRRCRSRPRRSPRRSPARPSGSTPPTTGSASNSPARSRTSMRWAAARWKAPGSAPRPARR